MTTWKIAYRLLLFATSCLASSMFAQQRPLFYVDGRLGGPQFDGSIPGPAFQGGFLLNRQIGLGLMWEADPFTYNLSYGLGLHLRISSNTTQAHGWRLSLASGRGRRQGPNLPVTKDKKPGYLFSELTIGRYFKPRWSFDLGYRRTPLFTDFSSGLRSNQMLFQTLQFTYSLSKPSLSQSKSLTSFNQRTYFYSLYGLNIPIYRGDRLNALVNTGIGWKLNSTWGVGINSLLSRGLRFFYENQLDGVGIHALRKKGDWLTFTELGIPIKPIEVGHSSDGAGTRKYRQDPSTTPIYTRFGLGYLFQKFLLAHASFTLAPRIKEDARRTFSPLLPLPVVEEGEFYFGYVQFHLGLGVYIE